MAAGVRLSALLYPGKGAGRDGPARERGSGDHKESPTPQTGSRACLLARRKPSNALVGSPG